MRKAREVVMAGKVRRITRQDGRAASRPELGVPAPIFTLKAAIIP
jgi:hypothetical protein